MTRLTRLAKLEISVNGHLKQKKQKPLIDYSTYTDEELTSLYDHLMVEVMSEPSPYEGMTEQQLSDLYMQSIKKAES